MDTVVCLDKTAANRVMSDHYQNIQMSAMISELSIAIDQMDSINSVQILKNDSLMNAYNQLKYNKNFTEIQDKQKIKTFKIWAFVTTGLTIILTIIKL